MKRITLILLLLGTFTLAQASPKTDADKLYEQEKYKEAAAAYQNIIDNEGIAAELYYNLGNSYYKLDDIPNAILNYERALRIDPSDDDTRTNLALARSKTSDKVTPPSEMFFVTWWKNLCNSLSIHTWTTLAVASFILMLLGILAYMFLSSTTLRKIGIYSAIVLFFAVILANLCALGQHLTTRSHTDGIIFSSAVTVKSSPSESSTDLFIIHSGSKVEILDNTLQDWYEVRLEEGKQGWIPTNTLEVI
ncbi:MAG: tetratricopeptide repeat protein [Bacteroidaceae bacterium]|nr:tetratricopeptide repeat protein [Bacteroidaceae bacterium]MDO4995073.1 tetratricopeptide repeat protein [Bacteroidales bacterium]